MLATALSPVTGGMWVAQSHGSLLHPSFGDSLTRILVFGGHTASVVRSRRPAAMLSGDVIQRVNRILTVDDNVLAGGRL